jgi:hypothetical protein
VERLENEIVELAAHIHAATCRWLGLVAEFDRLHGWEAWGCRSCAHWIAWRCSISDVAARDQVRVARRLQELPRIREAYAAGELSYSKVRALTRVGAVAREDELLGLARHATAAQLERMVRGYRRVVAAERAADGRPESYVTWQHDDDGSLLLYARLPAEAGATVLAALEAGMDDSAEAPVASDSAEAQVAGASAEAADFAEAPTVSERRADALVAVAESFLAGARADRADDHFQVVVHVDAAALRDSAEAGRAELADGTPIAAETARRLACDAALVPLLERDGKPLSVGRKTRAIPPALRRALESRDGGCRFPGCTSRRRVHAHHIEHWAHGGETKLSNLVQLCPFHHRLVHEGGFALERSASGLRFRRPDGRVIGAVPRPTRGCERDLRAGNARRVRPKACVPLWSGERLDLGLAVDALLQFAPLPGPPGV